MKTILQIERPYVHGALQVSWIGEVLTRLHVCSDTLTVNNVAVIIEGVLVRRVDEWCAESFKVQRAGITFRNDCGKWKTSRRNQEKAHEVVLDVVSRVGGRAIDKKINHQACAPETRERSCVAR